MIPYCYAAIHFFVDFICAWAMFSTFRLGPDGYGQLLVYNFCAFALQMPLGALLDMIRSRITHDRGRFLSLIFSGTGMGLTVLGAFSAPWILGIGNALFHVGGGMEVMDRSDSRKTLGINLGVFVAPGALGLYLGTAVGNSSCSPAPVLVVLPVLLFLLILPAYRRREGYPSADTQVSLEGYEGILLAVCCFLVVMIRSAVGFHTGFSWKSDPVLGWCSVFAVAGGKMAGGYLSAVFGLRRTVCLTLLMAAGFFLLGRVPIFGIASLFLFNMTMPITLYLLAENMPHVRGFAFGMLTFGLFLGFLPVYGNPGISVEPEVIGAAGSILTLALLMIGCKGVDHG